MTSHGMLSEAFVHGLERVLGWEYTKTASPIGSPPAPWPARDTPPGEGWVLNVDKGDGGHELGTAVEVTYWRRRAS